MAKPRIQELGTKCLEIVWLTGLDSVVAEQAGEEAVSLVSWSPMEARVRSRSSEIDCKESSALLSEFLMPALYPSTTGTRDILRRNEYRWQKACHPWVGVRSLFRLRDGTSSEKLLKPSVLRAMSS